MQNTERVKPRSNAIVGTLFLLPSILLMTVFVFYPMLKTLYYSFFITNPRGLPVEFVGFENYIELMKSESFIKSMKASFLFVLYTVPTGILLAYFLAIIANERLKGIAIFRVIFSSTLGVSVAAGASIWLFLFHPSLGALNNILRIFGIHDIHWLTDPEWALISIAVTTVWMSIGFNFIVLLAGLQSIPEELYESASIDGAGFWTKLFRLTIPLSSPTIFFVTVVSVIHSFQSFGQIDILTKGGPSGATNLVVYSIYRDAFINFKFGYASAQSIILFLLILIFTIIQFKVGEKRVHYQ